MLTDPNRITPEGRKMAETISAAFALPLAACIRAQAELEQRQQMAERVGAYEATAARPDGGLSEVSDRRRITRGGVSQSARSAGKA